MTAATRRFAGVGRWLGIAVVAPVVLVGALWLAPSPAAASEHEMASEEAHHGAHGHEEGPPSIDGGTLALQLLNFGVLVAVLVFFGGKAINRALGARHEQLKADLASASELRAAAEAKLVRQEARLGSLEAEIAEMRRGLKLEAEAEKQRLIAAAEERAARIKTETSFLIDQQVREADQRLRRDSADAALKIAEEILRRSIGAADQQRLLATFVAEVERDGAATGGRAV